MWEGNSMTDHNIIKISKEYPGLWLGQELTIPPGASTEDKIKKWIEAHDEMNQAYQRLTNMPMTDFNKGYDGTWESLRYTITDIPEDISKAIQSCKEIKVLETYKLLVKGKADLETLYLNKLEELSK